MEYVSNVFVCLSSIRGVYVCVCVFVGMQASGLYCASV
jgi:hypothetical protein